MFKWIVIVMTQGQNGVMVSRYYGPFRHEDNADKYAHLFYNSMVVKLRETHTLGEPGMI